MSKKMIRVLGLLLLSGVGLGALIFGCGSSPEQSTEGAHGGEAQEPTKGPHGGRLLAEGDFATEVTIYESGVPPEFRVFCFEKNVPIDPAQVSLSIVLRRFGGLVNTIAFSKQQDYLLGDQTIVEPHSFDVEVVAEHAGKTHRWMYASYEGRTQLSPEAITNAGIVIETAGPATVRTVLEANGRVVPNEDHLAQIIPRYPGVVREVRKRLGDPVAKDEVLAIVESNESLQPYEVKASIAGTVIHKNVNPGAYAREGESIYTVADLRTVWVDINVYRQDFARLKVGQPVTIDAGEGVAKTQSRIAYLSPFGAEDTQTMLARAVVSNPAGDWRPGLFVTGEITVDEVTVPVAVRASALQTFRDWDVVFLNDGELFEISPLELGRRDGAWVEVVQGLRPGQRYVAENSFLIKADIGKSGASHDH